MYHAYWGLRETPFRDSLEPRCFFRNPTHDEALARLDFLVQQQRRLGLLQGASGSGKSLVLGVFASGAAGAGHVVAKMSLAAIDVPEWLAQLATQLRTWPDRQDGTATLWRRITDRLRELRYENRSAVALFDDVHDASSGVLGHVMRLVRWSPEADSRLTIVVVADAQRLGRLGRDLLERVELRIDLEPWEPADTAAFVQASLRLAGRDAPLFDGPALAKLHELTHGIPRRVSQLADLALMAGAGRHVQRIDADLVESVYYELGVVQV